MSLDMTNAVPKVHPATRAVEPDDPLNLHGVEVAGDPQLMLRLLVEEYARLGFGLEALMQFSRDPFYLGFHGLWRLFGEDGLRRRIGDILARVGVSRVRVVEAVPAVPPPDDEPVLVQLGVYSP